MSDIRRHTIIMIAIVVSLCGLLHLAVGWWSLVWAPILLLIGGLVLMLSSPKAAVPGETEIRPDPFMESGPRNSRIKGDLLPSREDDYPFLFSAMVMWRWTGAPDPRLRNPAGQARSVVVDRARKNTVRYHPGDHDVARHQIAAALGVAMYTYEGALEVWAEDVELTLREEDLTRLDRLSRVRKENAVWEVEKSVEAAKREYYAEDVLATPGSAIVWDLVRGGTDVERTHGLIETLARLAEASKGEDLADLLTRLRDAAPEEFAFLRERRAEEPDTGFEMGPVGYENHEGRGAGAEPGHLDTTAVARALLQEVDDKDEDSRIQFVHRLVVTLEKAGSSRLAEEIRHLHPLPDDEEGEETVSGEESGFSSPYPGADWFGYEFDAPSHTRNGAGA
ncbi:hypothetical protein [Nocardiopsis alkaliphila]|uniref:hypothetical protein n=1 Tax=Nocardiopsis alkaliphila TaxID=225762 RepID=UPI000345DFD8|nr:hypothetical protein [Nocardiopsis alkaliphila]